MLLVTRSTTPARPSSRERYESDENDEGGVPQRASSGRGAPGARSNAEMRSERRGASSGCSHATLAFAGTRAAAPATRVTKAVKARSAEVQSRYTRTNGARPRSTPRKPMPERSKEVGGEEQKKDAQGREGALVELDFVVELRGGKREDGVRRGGRQEQLEEDERREGPEERAQQRGRSAGHASIRKHRKQSRDGLCDVGRRHRRRRTSRGKGNTGLGIGFSTRNVACALPLLAATAAGSPFRFKFAARLGEIQPSSTSAALPHGRRLISGSRLGWWGLALGVEPKPMRADGYLAGGVCTQLELRLNASLRNLYHLTLALVLDLPFFRTYPGTQSFIGAHSSLKMAMQHCIQFLAGHQWASMCTASRMEGAGRLAIRGRKVLLRDGSRQGTNDNAATLLLGQNSSAFQRQTRVSTDFTLGHEPQISQNLTVINSSLAAHHSSNYMARALLVLQVIMHQPTQSPQPSSSSPRLRTFHSLVFKRQDSSDNPGVQTSPPVDLIVRSGRRFL
ncbi:hypothetical protein C8R45DRAFT_1080120 [Mycena sanguinolenta]|nr:hypothetical protein C8R45DRAFT_1080120 [Mycena sanguinolenta]